MVFLSRVLAGMPKARIKWYSHEQLCRGPDAVKDLLPLTIMNLNLASGPNLAVIERISREGHVEENWVWNSARGKPGPGFKKMYYCVLFQRKLRLRVTLGTQRAIQYAGGFDRYIFYTPEEKLKSTLALSLRRRMQELIKKHPHVLPPPLNKRAPKPVPKDLAQGLKRVEVCDVNKFVYLG